MHVSIGQRSIRGRANKHIGKALTRIVLAPRVGRRQQIVGPPSKSCRSVERGGAGRTRQSWDPRGTQSYRPPMEGSKMLLLIFLWTISVTSFIDDKEVSGPPGAPPPRNEQPFATLEQCLGQLDKDLTMMEGLGVIKRLTKYQTESVPPDLYGGHFTQRWKCQEIK